MASDACTILMVIMARECSMPELKVSANTKISNLKHTIRAVKIRRV